MGSQPLAGDCVQRGLSHHRSNALLPVGTPLLFTHD
jgi:hypothetical protein